MMEVWIFLVSFVVHRNTVLLQPFDCHWRIPAMGLVDFHEACEVLETKALKVVGWVGAGSGNNGLN